MEEFGNFGITALAAGITAGATTITVTDGTKLPTAPSFHLLINSELVYVTAVPSTATYTISRGREGTTAASHAISAGVVLVFSVEAFKNFRADNFQAGTFANVPTVAARGGRAYIANDSPWLYLNDGSTIQAYGPIRKMIRPNLADFAWVNQGDAWAEQATGGIWLHSPSSTNVNEHHMLKKTIPSKPFSVVAYVHAQWDNKNYYGAGIGFRESSTGKLHLCRYVHTADDGISIEVNKWNDPTTYAGLSTQLWQSELPVDIHWYKIYHDGSNYHFYVSPTGFHWYEMSAFAINNHFTTDADEVVFVIDAGANAAGFQIGANLLAWEEGTS